MHLAQRMHYRRFYGAIDLGTNTCRLLIAGEGADGQLHVVETFSRIVCLGEGVSDRQFLSQKAMDRTLDVLSQCAEKLTRYGDIDVRCIATEACRRAQNGPSFLKQVQEKTGLSFELIDHQEESRLALLGCHSFIDPEKPFTLLFDIGGGSTEILWIANDGVTGTSRGQSFVSLPYGVVGVAETHTPTMAGNYRRVVSMVQQALDPFASRHDIDHYIAHNQVQLLGTSGTATTAAVLFLGLNRYERKKNAGITLSFDDLYRSIQHLHMILSSDHAHHYHLGSSRADLMMAGLAILEGICDTFQVGFLTATDRGVREGIIADLQRRRSSDAAPRYKGGTVGNDDAPIPRVVGF